MRSNLEPTTDPPSTVGEERHWFDEVAEAASHHVATGPFFAVTTALMGVWLVMGWVTEFSDRWLNIGSTCMVVVTFALLAILENAQRRSAKAVHRKLNVLVRALAEVMQRAEAGHEGTVEELHRAAGLEHRESTR
jgi:low affinity Fe/Cu permease